MVEIRGLVVSGFQWRWRVVGGEILLTLGLGSVVALGALGAARAAEATEVARASLAALRDEAQCSKLGGTNDPGSLVVGGFEGRGGAGSLPQWGQLGRGHNTRANALSAGAQRGGAPEFSGEMIGRSHLWFPVVSAAHVASRGSS